MIKVTFQNSTTIRGKTASEVLDVWRMKQWSEVDEASFRDELAKRAYIWSGALVDVDTEPDQFLNDLANAGILEMEVGN